MASTSIMIGDENISGSLQGVEIKTFDQLYQGMAPKIRPLNSSILVVGGKRIDNLKLFDESLTTDVGTKKIEQFPNFEKEDLSFGFGEEYKKDTIFNDIPGFDPVAYLNISSTEEMFPSTINVESYHNVSNYDGVIEPLTIRSVADQSSINLPFEPHSVKGCYSNAGEDVRKRSNPIVDFVFPIDFSVEPYLDETFGQDSLNLYQQGYLSAPSDSSSPFSDGTDWEDAAANLEGEIGSALLINTTSTEQMFPRGAISAPCGQIVNLEDSPGTDSIAYAGMKR